MRRRRWVTWLVFALCALLVVDVLGWATWRVLRLEQAERLATARADAGRRERLALWRMDSLVSALLAREAARPYFVYRPRYAADRPYDRAWEVDGSASVRPSPLAGGTGDPLIRLHYLVEPDGRLISPQTTPANEIASPEALRARRLLRDLDGARPGGALLSLDAPALPAAALLAPSIDPAAGPPRDDSKADDPEDARLRQNLYDIARQGPGFRFEAEPATRIDVGMFRPRWIGLGEAGATGPEQSGPELVFERPVTIESQTVVQGVWIDWPSLHAELLAVAVRLVPGSTLEPVPEGSGAGAGALATVPMRLIAPDVTASLPISTPTRITLGVTWAAVCTALTAIGVVLRTATRLADRRGRFVTAVTHELRSPLTSFRLYTDLLRAGGDDPAARARYLDALSREAGRLAAVVENVLAYAGLTRRRPDARPSRLGDLLDPLLASLAERAERAGVAFATEIAGEAAEATVRVAPGSLERILANLVDNACRHGAGGERPSVRLSAERAGPAVRVRVSDRGAGVPARDRRRIFAAFARGASPGDDRGVGLGLSLARGLARAEGGDLRLLRHEGPGATFEVRLPVLGPATRAGDD